jgi:hypothetical protein
MKLVLDMVNRLGRRGIGFEVAERSGIAEAWKVLALEGSSGWVEMGSRSLQKSSGQGGGSPSILHNRRAA